LLLNDTMIIKSPGKQEHVYKAQLSHRFPIVTLRTPSLVIDIIL